MTATTITPCIHGENEASCQQCYDNIVAQLDAMDKVRVTVGDHGMTATNAQPSKYGRWVVVGNRATFKLNKKGKHRVARRGEL